MANDSAPEGTKRRTVTRWYLHDSNMDERTARAGLDVNTVGFTFEDGQEESIKLASVFGGTLPPPCVGRAAAAFGINTSAGNAANTAENKTAVGAREAVGARLETFAEGRWTTERAEGGPRASLFFDALIAFRQSKGADVSEAKIAELRQKFSEPEAKKAALATGEFKKFYLQMQMERQLAAAETAGGNAATLLD